MAVSSIDLSVVDDSMLSERLTLVMEVEGRDLAGNTVRSFSETSLTIAGQWNGTSPNSVLMLALLLTRNLI